MKFFADTADTADIRDLADTGLLDGVTTNPSLIHKAGRDFLEVVKEICEIVPGMPVSAEVVALDFEGMMRAYGRHYGSDAQPNRPVRSTVQVAGLVRPGILVEVEVTAVVPAKR